MSTPDGTFDRDSPTREILDQVTSRWGTLVLAALAAGPHRFTALRDKVAGIGEPTLSQTLKQLVRAGLVHRTVEATTPTQVTYSLTALGSDLAIPLGQLIGWIGQHADDLLEAQHDYDATTPARDSRTAHRSVSSGARPT